MVGAAAGCRIVRSPAPAAPAPAVPAGELIRPARRLGPAAPRPVPGGRVSLAATGPAGRSPLRAGATAGRPAGPACPPGWRRRPTRRHRSPARPAGCAPAAPVAAILRAGLQKAFARIAHGVSTGSRTIGALDRPGPGVLGGGEDQIGRQVADRAGPAKAIAAEYHIERAWCSTGSGAPRRGWRGAGPGRSARRGQTVRLQRSVPVGVRARGCGRGPARLPSASTSAARTAALRPATPRRPHSSAARRPPPARPAPPRPPAGRPAPPTGPADGTRMRGRRGILREPKPWREGSG